VEESSPTGKQGRTQALDPDLVNQLRSDAWAFSLTQGFKNALDIQSTTIMKNKVASQAWTQGQNYNFQVGDTIYDTPAGRESLWSEALGMMRTCLEVVSARKAEPASFTEGEVVFRVLHPNSAHTHLEASKTYQGTQNEFVGLLRTGLWLGVPHEQL
jgi:hypothetical protein